MTVYPPNTEVGRAALNAFATVDRDDAHVPADHAELTVLILSVAVGLTATFFALGCGADIGQILATSG